MSRNVARIALLSLALSACHHASSRAIRGPGGETWYRVVCRSNFRDDCFDEAERLCPGGYATGDRSQSLRGFYTVGASTMAVAEDEMLIRCAPRAEAPGSTGGLVPYRATSDPGF